MILGLSIAWLCPVSVAIESTRLWPVQRSPAGIVSVDTLSFVKAPQDARPLNLTDDAFLAQSLAGLAALAVNEGRGDELVYVDLWDNASYHTWRSHVLKRTGIEDRGYATVWDLAAKYHKQGIIAGYILYSSNNSSDDADASVNIGTSIAGILKGILVSEEQEAQAKKLGLPKILDVRGKTEDWCLEEFKDRLNRKQVLLQSPEIPNNRAIAIAHQVLTIRGTSELAERVYQWLEAPALIHGWNHMQTEGESVQQLSSWGHFLCPSDWAMNLPVLSLGAAELSWPGFSDQQAQSYDHTSDDQQRVSFVLSDGDNLQWILGDFAWNDKYWHSPKLETIPFGFGLPVADLIEVAPDAYLHFQRTKSKQTSIIVAPQYVFLDHLGTKRSASKRESLQRWYGARIEKVLSRTGLNSIILICEKLEDPQTLKAWETLAANAPSLQAVFVMQYHPYEAGDGRVWKVERPEGQPVPFISAKFSIWSRANRSGAGTPVEVAEMLNSSRIEGPVNNSNWIAVHAWSSFTEDNESQDADYQQPGSFAGVAAAAWCAKHLNSEFHDVSPGNLVRSLMSPALQPDRDNLGDTTSSFPEGSVSRRSVPE